MKRIAVIDDDRDMVRLLRQILAEHHEVTTYSTGGARLVNEIAAAPVACVLLDIDLGNMNGITVLRALRADARTKHIPVIALTAHSKETERAKYLSEGFDDYIAKPFQPDVLLATVETALSGTCAPFVDEEIGDVAYVQPTDGE